MRLSILYTMYSSICALRDRRASMSPESRSKVLRAAGKTTPPLHNRDLTNRRHVFVIAVHFELVPFSLMCYCLSVLTSRWCLSLYIHFPCICIVYNVVCHLLIWETHEEGHRLVDGQLSSPYLPSPSFRSFGAASVMFCSFPPASSSTPLRQSLYYFLEEALLIYLVNIS